MEVDCEIEGLSCHFMSHFKKNRSNSEIIKRSFVNFNVARRRQSNLLSALGFTWKLNDAQRSTFLEHCIAQYKALLIAIGDTVQEDARVFDEGVKALGLTVKLCTGTESSNTSNRRHARNSAVEIFSFFDNSQQ